jgi:hypothetical protein
MIRSDQIEMMMLIDRNRVDEDNFVYEVTLGGWKDTYVSQVYDPTNSSCKLISI